MFLIRKDVDLFTECGFLKSDIHRLCLEFKFIWKEENKDYLEIIKNEEESIIERTLNNEMDVYFATMFEDVRHERSLIILLSLTDPDRLKQKKLTNHEIKVIKNLAFEILHRQRMLKEYSALQLLD